MGPSPRTSGKRLFVASIFALLLLLPRVARAAIALCVDVRAPESEMDGLRKLVKGEIARHPSHETVATNCRSNLAVEIFDAGGARYLTVQIDREVPVRFVIKDPIELGSRVAEAVRLVLHNDPAYLSEDIAHYSSMQRLGHSIGVGGRFTFRLETFELIVGAGTNAVFAPAIALGATRGSGNWQVLGRIYGGTKPSRPMGIEKTLPVVAGIDGGISYEFFDKAFASPYIATCLGVQYLQFSGRWAATDAQISSASNTGVSASVRLGARFFRWHAFDLDLFAQGYLPLGMTKDVDGALFGDSGVYTPSLQLGIGVGF